MSIGLSTRPTPLADDFIGQHHTVLGRQLYDIAFAKELSGN